MSRSHAIKVKALDRHGHEIYESHSGYVARIFQHEIDHLNGIRFPERVPDQSFLHLVKTEEMHAYRNGERWRNWEKTIPQKEWKGHV